MKHAVPAVALLLAAGLGCSFSAEPVTSQDSNFPLIQLPAQFQAQRHVGDFNPGLGVGETRDLFNETGPGCIRHFWLVPYPNTANPVLRIYVDDPDTPKIEMRMHEFFGVLLGEEPYRLTNAAFNHLPMQQGPVQGAGYNCYLPIPFQQSCRITIEAVDAEGVIAGGSMVDWQQYAPETVLTPYRLHAVHSEATPTPSDGSFSMASIAGRGFVAGIIQGIRQRDAGASIYETGGQRWLIDGQTDPRGVRGTKLEDDFGFAWQFQDVMTRWIGTPYLRTTGPTDTDAIFYRFFGPDPMRFDSSLVLAGGSRGDDMEVVVYYYLADGITPPPDAFSPTAWQVTGPFPCPDHATFRQVEVPESLIGTWPDPIMDGGTDYSVHTVDSGQSWLDVSTLYQNGGSPDTLTDHSVYARVRFQSGTTQTIDLQFGFDDWLTVWLNGVELTSLRHDSGFAAATVPAPLLAGENELLVKLSNFGSDNSGLWAFNMHTADDPTLVQVDPLPPEGTVIPFTQKGWEPGDLSTDGMLVMAVNLGTTLDATVDGISFEGDNDGSYTSNSVTATFFGADYVSSSNAGNYGGSTFPTGANAENLLDHVGYAYRAGGADGTIEFSGLAIGNTYELQFLMVDDLPGSATRTIDVSSGVQGVGSSTISDADYTSRSDDRVLLINGTFTAGTTTQSVRVRGLKPAPDYAGWVNAMQLREIVDGSPPLLATVDPPNWATDVATGTNLVMMFDEPVQPGGGNLLVRRFADDSVAQAVDVTSGSVTFAGAEVTVDLPSALDDNTGYYIQIPTAAIQDATNNGFAGITDKNEWNFTTVANGAGIVFTQQGFLQESDLSTEGTLLAAVNLGTAANATVNGTLFDGDNDGFYSTGSVTISFFGANYVFSQNPGNYGGTTVTGPDAETLLDNVGYAYNPGGADGSVQISGLTPGHAYELQLLLADDLPQNSARTVDVFDGGSGTGSPAIADADYSSRLDGSALLVTGTFIATTGSRSFFVRGLKPTPDHAGWINAFQLRDLGAPDDAFSTWADSFFPGVTDPAVIGFAADPDGDRIANGLEWILGGRPGIADATSLFSHTLDPSGDLTVSFTRKESAIGAASLVLQWCTDLATWNNIPIDHDGGTYPGDIQVAIDQSATPDAVTVTIPPANAPGGSLFVRLQATAP